MSLGIIIPKINLVADMYLCYEFLVIRNYNRKAENRRNYCAKIIKYWLLLDKVFKFDRTDIAKRSANEDRG